MRRRAALGVVVAGALGIAGPAAAHTMSDGHLELEVEGGDRLVGTLDVAIRDLHDAFGLDPDGDRQITWPDLVARRGAIADYVTAHLAIATADGACRLATGDLGVVDRPDGAHVAIAITAACPAAIGAAVVDYRLLYDLDAEHRGLLRIGAGRGIARRGGGPVTIAPRGRLGRIVARVPGGAAGAAAGGGVLALAIAVFALRRTTRWRRPGVAVAALGVAAVIGAALHRLLQ